MTGVILKNEKGNGVWVPERAFSFQTFKCTNPDCPVVHIVPERKDGTSICEVAVTGQMLQEIITLYFAAGTA